MAQRGRPPKNKPVAETIKKETIRKQCKCCLKERPLEANFYVSNSKFEPDGRTSTCKDCFKEQIDYENLQTVKDVLREMNRPFLDDVWISNKEECNKKGSSDYFGGYLKNVQLNNKSLGWNDSSIENVSVSENRVVIPVKDEADNENKNVYSNDDIVLTPEDIRSQEDCHKLLGYDPFSGYITLDRKFMYAELIPYLDEDTLEDQHKISIIIQLINNNSQIRKMDQLINKLSSDFESLLKNSAEIKNLTAIKKQITDNNDKLAKENAIAIKHRGDKKAGRSTLGYIMKDLRELGFENAEEDYYDMKKAYGMQMTADISAKAIVSQLNFDEKDIEDMFKNQRDLIEELQSAKEELEEKLRLANKQIIELKLSGESNA